MIKYQTALALSIDHACTLPVSWLRFWIFACNLVPSVRLACIVSFVPAQVIRIPGYIADEKVHIARQYLEPQSMRESGIPESAASISDDAMHTLIHEYARCRHLLPGLSWTFCRLVIPMWQTAFVIQEIWFWPHQLPFYIFGLLSY